jgi:hypothetical protein
VLTNYDGRNEDDEMVIMVSIVSVLIRRNIFTNTSNNITYSNNNIVF